MAYKKTPEVLAGIAARKSRIIKATIASIARNGLERVYMADVAKRARVAIGLAYKYFPDRDEVIVQAINAVRDLDRAAIRQAADSMPSPSWALVNVITVFYSRIKHPHLVRALWGSEHYRRSIEAELSHIIGDACEMTPRDRQKAAGAVLGLMYGLFVSTDGARRQEHTAALYALRAIGMSDAKAREHLERYKMEAA